MDFWVGQWWIKLDQCALFGLGHGSSGQFMTEWYRAGLRSWSCALKHGTVSGTQNVGIVLPSPVAISRCQTVDLASFWDLRILSGILGLTY